MKLSPLFLAQSYQDNWADYERSLSKANFIKWDYIILTASNESQAKSYRRQIDYRLANKMLPSNCRYGVLPDPDGKRVGSGGATLNVLKFIAENTPSGEDPFKGKRILVIHSGGDSKRIPQYSACGKLFSPVPRELPNGRRSTLFDEFIIGMSGVPSRIQDGMLVLSGDVLLLFNPLQIDFQGRKAAAISIKEPVATGKNHGVFLSDENGFVKKFLHKQSEESLQNSGAVNQSGKVDLDTGAVLFSSQIVGELFSLISENGQLSKAKFNEFVNEKARLSFYADFLYPLASDSTLEQYYKETPEGDFTEELRSCRSKIWSILSKHKMKLTALSPAEFIHFGTTAELINLVTSGVTQYSHLDWNKVVTSNVCQRCGFSASNSYIENSASMAENCYIEDSFIIGDSTIGAGSVVSNCTIENQIIPANVVLHGIKLKNGKFTARIYSTSANPKNTLENGGMLFDRTLESFVTSNDFEISDLWSGDDHSLWNARLYAECDTVREAVDFALNLYMLCNNEGDKKLFLNSARTSLCKSFNDADVNEILSWQLKLHDKIEAYNFIHSVDSGLPVEEMKLLTEKNPCTDREIAIISKVADDSEFSRKIRLYYYLSRLTNASEEFESKCFNTISETISNASISGMNYSCCGKLAKDEAEVRLPVRVNFGGGWSDTPPYCNENGGTVLNAAIKLKGNLPIAVRLKKLDKKVVQFESCDSGAKGEITSVSEIQACKNPFDPFALHKAALLACGIVPIEEKASLGDILEKLGGGLYLSTEVIDIPRGSGLGTSSILAGACVKGIFEILGQNISDSELFDRVLVMEQLMSTGGGWQDQVGGVTNGIKFITTKPGLKQKINCVKVTIPDSAFAELEERFVLIYTGQRRLARNLLREVVGKYIGARPQSVYVLEEIQKKAALMRFELERGNIDAFAELMNEHWELSKKLDSGSTNTCIDQIFMAAEPYISGRMICGAGGGGFLQVILKKGVCLEDLRKRLKEVFQDSGVDVWECEFI